MFNICAVLITLLFFSLCSYLSRSSLLEASTVGDPRKLDNGSPTLQELESFCSFLLFRSLSNFLDDLFRLLLGLVQKWNLTISNRSRTHSPGKQRQRLSRRLPIQVSFFSSSARPFLLSLTCPIFERDKFSTCQWHVGHLSSPSLAI